MAIRFPLGCGNLERTDSILLISIICQRVPIIRKNPVNRHIRGSKQFETEGKRLSEKPLGFFWKLTVLEFNMSVKKNGAFLAVSFKISS